MENTWAVEFRIPRTGEWVIHKADMIEWEASRYIIDRAVTGLTIQETETGRTSVQLLWLVRR